MPKPLFSSAGSVFRNRRPARPHAAEVDDDTAIGFGWDSTDTDDEDDVERSLPPSPAVTHFGTGYGASGAGNASGSAGAEAGPSMAMRFASDDEAVMRYAAGAFDDISQPQDGYIEEVKPDMYDSDDDMRIVPPDEAEHAADFGARAQGDFPDADGNLGAMGGLRYRAGHDREDDARRTAETAAEEEEEEEEIPAPDERQCRICFAGREEEDSMGRLISPCLCTGSMRVRHCSRRGDWRLLQRCIQADGTVCSW